MEDYISISMLNDFIFCPYSIYLHNIYMEFEEDIYHAVPQIRGKESHSTVDSKTTSRNWQELSAISVFSDELGVIGKIDIYRKDERWLIERKYRLAQIFKGQIYQLWAQYLCLTEMGYEVEKISFYEISTNKMTEIQLPSAADKAELLNFIQDFKTYDPLLPIDVNRNKCAHCIYCNLCDKTDDDNVYT